ncbi:hypothetical protein ACN4D5_06660 [Corynebacterium macclintockiae]|uniref:DNA polymerase III subunit beta family protein n=1 Tax=Corynebacterium macclintockiae TaxID=2913501 RepID=UPI003EBC3C70
MARKPRVPKAPRIGGGGGRKRGPLSAETKMKIARSLARVKGDTSDWDPYEKKGRAPGKGDNGSGGAGKKPARMTTTTAKGGAKVTSGIDKHTGNKVTVSKTSGTAGKNRKNAKATANPFGDFPDNTVKGGGHQASKEYLTPDNIREEPGFRSDLQAVADRLTTPAKAEKYLDRLDDRMVRAMEDTGSPAKNRHNQRAAIHNYTQARELGLIDAELNRTGKKPVMPSKDKLPEVKAGDPEGNAKRAKGINAPVAGDKGKQAPKMKATAGKRKPATVKGEKAAEKPAKAAKPAKPTAKGAKGTKSAKNANTKPAKHPKVHGTYTPEEQAAERANPGRKGGIIDREAENLTPRQLNRLARYYGLDNEQKINQLGVDKGNKKFRHTPEFEKSYDKWLAKTVAPALDKLDPNGTIDRNDPEAVLEALGVGRKDGVDTRRALTSPIYFQTLSGDVRAAIAEHVGFVPSPVNMQRTNRGEKRPAVFAEAFTIQHRRQKAGELPRFAEDRKPVKPVKRPKGKRKTTTPAKPGPKRAAKPTQQAQEPQAKPKPNKESVGNNKPTAPAPAKPAGGVTYRPADGDNMPAVGHHDGVTAKGTHITRPDGSSVRGDVKPVKVDTDPDRADRYDNNGRYAQITGDGKHLIVANNESELDNMLRDYNNGRGEVGKLVADNGEAPERDLGLSDWKNGNRDRTYVNKWHEPAGFEFETYKNSGRPSWATIDGKGISNTRADKLRGGKVWVDNKTGELHVEAGNDELPADKIAERLIPELERQLGHPVTYKPKNGGNKPDVKPDAKPNAEAEKVANAEADKAETIAALTPYLAAEPQRLPDTPETINDPVQKAVDKAKAPERVADSVTDNRDMADRLLDVASSRGRDETLHFLTGVNFNVHDGDATVAATDRFRLSTEHIKIDAPDGNHLVDGKDFGEAMRAMRGVEGDFKLTDNGDGTYTLTRGDVSRNLKGIPGEFPKVAPLMANVTEETPRFTVNAPALRKVALEAKRNSTRYGGLHFKPVEDKDAYHVSWTDKYGDVRTVDVPAKFSNDNPADRPAFAVNQTYLADILGGVKGNVTVGNDAGHRPLRIVTDGEEQPTRLLMPIRADVPDMVAKPDANNEARKQLNYLYDALATPKENRVAFNAKELRSLIKTAHEQATKDVKEGTPEYFLHATPDGRVRIAAGNAKSGVKVYGEMGIEPGQREMIIPLPNRDNRGNAIKAATINSNFRGDNAVFRVDDDGTVWLTTVSNETADQRNKGTVFTQGAVPIAHTPDMVRKYKQLLKKNGYDPDQGDSNDGMAALPGLNDVSKFDGDAAVKRAEKMEADRTRRELDEVGMTDAEKQTATAKRDNMPRLDGQNGLQAKAPTKATSKPDAQSSYTTAELKERGWKPKDIKALKEHKTTEKHRSATGVVDSFENNSRGQFTGYNLNRYDGDAVRDYEKGKDLGPHRVPTPPQIDGLELTSNKTRNGKTFFNVDNLADFTQNPEWFNVRLTPEGDVNVYEGKRLPPFPDGDDETWKWDTEKEALEKRLADALNGNVRHVERKPVQKQTRPPLPEGETLDRRDNVVRFRKAGGEWAVEGEDLQVGDVVTVKRRGGKKSTVTITELVSDENGHQVARFKNGGGRSRRAKRNTTTGGAKLDGQNRLQATKPQRARRGVEPIQQHELEDGENLTGIGDTVIQRGESQIRKGKDGYYVTGAGQSREGTPVATLESARKLADRYNTDNAAKVAEANAKDEADNAARRKLYDANPGDMKASRMDANVENALFTQSGTVRKNPKLRNLTDGELSRALDRDDLNTDMRKAIKGEQKNRELNGQNGLNATTPDKRAGTEITPGVVHGDNGAPRLAEGYNRFTGNPEKNYGRVPQTKEEIAAVQKWQDMPLKNWGERRKAERALNAKGIDTRTERQREVDAAVAAYKPTAAEKRPDSRGLYFNDLGAWQTTGYRANQTQLARPGEVSTEDRLITIGDREIFAPAGGTYGQKNGRIVLEGVDSRTGEKVKLKSDQFGQWNGPVTIRKRGGGTFGRYSTAATPQNMHAIQEAEERYPLSDRWTPKIHDDTETINKIKLTMAEDMIKSDPYMDKAPDISDDEARAWALEKIKGNEFRPDHNRQNQGQRARAHESLMNGEHKNMSIPRYTSPDSVHGPGGMYFTGETETPNIYRGLTRDPNEGRDKLTAALVDDPDARLVTSVPGEGLKFVRPVKVDEFRYGYRVTATDDEGKKHYVKIDPDDHYSGNVKIWRPLRHTDGTPYTRDEAAEYSSLKDELNKLPDVERVNWPEGRIWAQKREPEIEARLEALRGKTNPAGGNTTPAKALEFPELQLMSSAQLETIAAGTGAKAAAAQQLLNDRR